jgi:hypothetical protein
MLPLYVPEEMWPMAIPAAASVGSQCGKEALKKLHTVGSVPAAESELHCLTVCEFGIFGSEIMCVPSPLLLQEAADSGCLCCIQSEREQWRIAPSPGLL